jgi:hypothetical protein
MLLAHFIGDCFTKLLTKDEAGRIADSTQGPVTFFGVPRVTERIAEKGY